MTSTSHELNLKVMRLSRPFLNSSNIIPFEQSFQLQSNQSFTTLISKDLLKASTLNLSNNYDSNMLSLFSTTDFNLSDVLSLPGTFGNIHLGEIFSSYLCVNNDSHVSVQRVGIKAELQTSSQRFSLLDTSSDPDSVVSLVPNQSSEFRINHEIRELGVHILVCTITYHHQMEKKSFRKFYKFQVLNPILVKTKIVNPVNSAKNNQQFEDISNFCIKNNSNIIFIECQLQNLTLQPIYIEKLNFIFSKDLFKFTDLNCSQRDDNKLGGNFPDKNVFNEACLNPLDIRQYLFKLDPLENKLEEARAIQNLGKLEISWRSIFGQLASLETSDLTTKPLKVEAFELAIISIPDVIYSEEPFKLKLSLKNNSNTKAHYIISAVKVKMSSILLNGNSDLDLGEFLEKEEKNFEMEFFPLLTGLHKIVGVKVIETFSSVEREVDKLAEIFVVNFSKIIM
ncbi:hypothetical protein HDU92_003272 [Lobulomyces angularis]|nr:hypothetical protein HDU92_003272 [Lobulomyces angularis]